MTFTLQWALIVDSVDSKIAEFDSKRPASRWFKSKKLKHTANAYLRVVQLINYSLLSHSTMKYAGCAQGWITERAYRAQAQGPMSSGGP